MLFLGIDPGLSGAVAVIDGAGGFIACYDTPTLERLDKKKRKRHEYALSEIRTLIEFQQIGNGITLAALEAVHAFPEQGLQSTFMLGQGFGLWLGVLGMAGIPLIRVNPVRWQAHFGLLRQGKQASRLDAQQRWPQADLSKKKHDGRADALHLAEFARQQHLGIAKGGHHGTVVTSKPHVAVAGLDD